MCSFALQRPLLLCVNPTLQAEIGHLEVDFKEVMVFSITRTIQSTVSTLMLTFLKHPLFGPFYLPFLIRLWDWLFDPPAPASLYTFSVLCWRPLHCSNLIISQISLPSSSSCAAAAFNFTAIILPRLLQPVFFCPQNLDQNSQSCCHSSFPTQSIPNALHLMILLCSRRFHWNCAALHMMTIDRWAKQATMRVIFLWWWWWYWWWWWWWWWRGWVASWNHTEQPHSGPMISNALLSTVQLSFN